MRRSTAFALLAAVLAAPATFDPAAAADTGVRAVSMAETARQAFEYAEKTYPSLFPPGPQNLYLDTWAYRYYAATGLYLGLVTRTQDGRVAGDVYGMGGSFGAGPSWLGPVTRYITPQVQAQAVALRTNDLVADVPRGVFYASVPSTVEGLGNHIARIDAATGRVTSSELTASEPGPMALAGDGRSLYVGLNGSSEIVRLSLPDLALRARVELPFSGGPYVAERIATSPIDPGLIAVSLRRTGTASTHGGVVLIRNMEVQPRRAPESARAIELVFGIGGDEVFGLDSETAESGLRRLRVVSDGLELVGGVAADAGTGARLLRSGSMLLAGRKVFSTSTLALMSTLPVQGGCDSRNDGVALCIDFALQGIPRVLRIDMASGALLDQVAWADPTVPTGSATWAAGTSPWTALRLPDRVLIQRDEMMR